MLEKQILKLYLNIKNFHKPRKNNLSKANIKHYANNKY